MSDTGIVKIHNKEYHTVAKRINDLRLEHPEYAIETEILSNADLVVMKASISNGEGKLLGTGHAEEVRGSTNINKTSALENCETSAVGRALAFIGRGGTEIASADEVVNAINQTAVQDAEKGFTAHMQAVVNNWKSIQAIQKGIIDGDLSTASEAWSELGEETQRSLWRATTKGGIFTTKERETIKTTEFREAHFGANPA